MSSKTKIHLTEIEQPGNIRKQVYVDVKLSVACSPSSIPYKFRLRCPVVDGKVKVCHARLKSESEGNKFECHLETISKSCPTKFLDHEVDYRNPIFLNAYKAKTSLVESIVYHSFPCRDEKVRRMASVEEAKYLSIRECLFYPDARVIEQSCEDNIVDESGQQYKSQSLYFLTSENITLEQSSSIKVHGQIHPHPQTQTPTILVDKIEKSDSDISTFKLTDELRQKFEMIHSSDVEEVLNQLAYLTQINQRPLTHMIAMLVFHSVLGFEYQGTYISGVLDALLIGDSGVGKTQIMKSLIQKIKLGQFITGSSATRTGISYGILSVNKSFEIQWGAYPSNDRGLLVIDEGQDISKPEWENLSVGRSNGILTVNRIVRGEHPTRTRLIVLANPNSGKLIDSELYPCSHLKMIFTNKDIRRFDVAQALSANDVSGDDLLVKTSSSEKLSFLDEELLRASVMYAWSRSANQIKFSDGFDTELRRLCRVLMDAFGSATEIPLVGNDIRDKLLRLSAAHACFWHRTDSTGEVVVVSVSDLEFVSKLLSQIYISDNFGLGQYADTQKTESKLADSEYLKIREELVGDAASYPMTLIKRKLIKLFAQTSALTGFELSTSIDLDRKIIASNLDSFKKYGLIGAKPGAGYKATPKFNQFVRKLQSDGIRLQDIDQNYC